MKTQIRNNLNAMTDKAARWAASRQFTTVVIRLETGEYHYCTPVAHARLFPKAKKLIQIDSLGRVVWDAAATNQGETAMNAEAIKNRITRLETQARNAQSLAYTAAKTKSGGVCRMLDEADRCYREADALKRSLRDCC